MIAIAVMVIVLAAQIVIPLVRLSDDRGTRFGWQMYSAVRPAPEFQVHTEASPVAIDLEDYVVSLRLDVDIEGHLPTHLCTVIPGAREVIWEEGSYRC